MTFSPRSRAEMVHNYSLGEHFHPLRLHWCELETLGTQRLLSRLNLAGYHFLFDKGHDLWLAFGAESSLTSRRMSYIVHFSCYSKQFSLTIRELSESLLDKIAGTAFGFSRRL